MTHVSTHFVQNLQNIDGNVAVDPGCLVRHRTDPTSSGVVLSRRQEPDDDRCNWCDVMWSRAPRAIGDGPVRRRRRLAEMPVPESAEWTGRIDDIVGRHDGKWNLSHEPVALFDGHETYAPDTLTDEDVRDLQHMSSQVSISADGRVYVNHRNVQASDLPTYMRQDGQVVSDGHGRWRYRG